MRLLLTLLVLSSTFTNAQVSCGMVDENQVLTLTAPAGYRFSSIEYASYGTPNGSCGAFTNGACHAVNSVSICSTAFVGRTSASINASNGVFGDPCVGTLKRLYVQVRYDVILPLKLVSFSAVQAYGGEIRLTWLSENEINTYEFIVERGRDGMSFVDVGKIPAEGTGSNAYTFKTQVGDGHESFYRLRMIDIDGKFQYSNTIRVENRRAGDLNLVYDGTSGTMTVYSDQHREAAILNAHGQKLKKVMLTGGTQKISVSDLTAGYYLFSTQKRTIKFIRR